MSKKAYFAEYPDLGITVIVEDDGETQQINTAGCESTRVFMDHWRERGFEVYAFTCTWETRQDPDDAEREYKHRRWRPIVAEAAVS